MSGRLRPDTALWVESESTIDAWAAEARRGDEIVYAHGPALPQMAAAIRVRQLAGRGIVHPFQRRDGREFDYVARLLRERPAPKHCRLIGSEGRAVVDYLRRHVRLGEAMPTGTAISIELGLRGDGHANNVLHRLRRCGVIDWQTAPGGCHQPARRVLTRMEMAA
ncbi:hypothetical protein SAMN06295912_108137 [Sphingomonas laterariae]|uniref:Uncharacterized protein n=1 Tax=Edaphosphingomonas laterariae TaxID=861865 RepID=A0A239FA82_9SPHN|nr:hypothetical protein [Sphingomonas laterariae]SNS53651.1 hypothetical protein SAMN06295912_108137 [Sphingomonas laterariae]